MTVFYFDTSALVKRYVRETGTDWVRALTDPGVGNTILLAEIGMVEAAAAIAANHRAPGGIRRHARDVAVRLLLRHCATEYQPVPFDRTILDRALLLTPQHRLRGYDAVHLASALTANAVLIAAASPPLTLVTADRDQRDAAVREGLAIDKLEDHP